MALGQQRLAVSGSLIDLFRMNLVGPLPTQERLREPGLITC
jgi:hypothetical protein